MLFALYKRFLTPFFVYLQEGGDFFAFFFCSWVTHCNTSHRAPRYQPEDPDAGQAYATRNLLPPRWVQEYRVKLDHHLDLNNMSKLKPLPPVIYFFAIPPKIRRFMSFCRSQLSSTVKTFKIINGKLDVTCTWAFFPVKSSCVQSIMI